MLLLVADLPPLTHIHNAPAPAVTHHNHSVIYYDSSLQYTGKFRFLARPNHQPQLQQEYTDRKTYELKWINVPFVHSKR